MVSPAAKLGVTESVPAAPDSFVAAVIATGVANWLNSAVPVTVLSPGAVAGVPRGNGLLLKSNGLRPPRALIVPAAAVELTAVVGVDGTLASGLPVFGSTPTPIK